MPGKLTIAPRINDGKNSGTNMIFYWGGGGSGMVEIRL